MPWWLWLIGSVSFLASAGFQYQNYRRTPTRRSLISAILYVVTAFIFAMSGLSEAGWEPAMRLTCL